MTSFLVRSMHLYRNTSPCITQLVQFIESLKCIVAALTEKTSHPPFEWVFSSNYPFSVSQMVGACQNARNIKTYLFCLHSARLQGRGGGKKKTRWVLIQLKIMRVEGFSSGALLYWTWRTTCTTSTYTFSNASRHGVKTTPPVCATNVSVAPVSDNV